ncbi:MAG: DUF115 domain-containing protein [Candidatus Lokiarchaeota archaeon]|nr:DUF115 domain-containing protein [Candidatus Lokiarchaeota archaeon]
MSENDQPIQKQLDMYAEFRGLYLKIVKDLCLSEKKDNEARDLLSQYIEEKKRVLNYDIERVLHSFRREIQSKSIIIIYGCGPSLEESVNYLVKEMDLKHCQNIVNLVADGASILLREQEISLHAVFSDLDGVTEEEINASRFFIILGHGDNIKRLKTYHDALIRSKNLIGTTQVKSTENLINSGGFTDGDRILYFLRPFLTTNHSIFLIGMDFNNIVGKYSKPYIKSNQKASVFKQKKLNHAAKLMELVLSSIDNDIYFVNSPSISKKFKSLTLEEAKNKILLLK